MRYKSNLALTLSVDLKTELEELVKDINEKSKGLEGQEDFIRGFNEDIDDIRILLGGIESSKNFLDRPNPTNILYLTYIRDHIRYIEKDVHVHVKAGNGIYAKHLENLRGYRESIEEFLR